VFSPWSIPEKKARKWMWIALAAVAALQFYYVQEMIAAFVVLGVLFALVAGASLLVVLVDRARARTLSWAEMSAMAIFSTARRAVNCVAMAAKGATARAPQVSLLNRMRLRHPRLGTVR
jgi:hypothetical protein